MGARRVQGREDRLAADDDRTARESAGVDRKRKTSAVVRRRVPLLEWHETIGPNFICKSGGKGKTLFLYIYSVLLFIRGTATAATHLQVL